MRTLTLDMRQYDCPFIDTTDDHDVAFAALHWDFKQNVDRLETRMVVDGADEGALMNGLHALRDHPELYDHELLSKRESDAHIRTVIGETDAMHTIREHGGYITGPFHIEDGSELWNLGFDSREVADRALAALDRENEFTVESKIRLDVSDIWGYSRNVDTVLSLVRACTTLTDTEQRTLEVAFNSGFLDTPREVTLADIGDELDVSQAAVSKNLRRAQRKITGGVLDALDLEASR